MDGDDAKSPRTAVREPMRHVCGADEEVAGAHIKLSVAHREAGLASFDYPNLRVRVPVQSSRRAPGLSLDQDDRDRQAAVLRALEPMRSAGAGQLIQRHDQRSSSGHRQKDKRRRWRGVLQGPAMCRFASTIWFWAARCIHDPLAGRGGRVDSLADGGSACCPLGAHWRRWLARHPGRGTGTSAVMHGRLILATRIRR
jgi:hypothetical protein